MNAAILTVRIWATQPAGLADTIHEVAEVMTSDLDHIKDLCAQGYVAGEVTGDGYRGWWEIKEGAE